LGKRGLFLWRDGAAATARTRAAAVRRRAPQIADGTDIRLIAHISYGSMLRSDAASVRAMRPPLRDGAFRPGGTNDAPASGKIEQTKREDDVTRVSTGSLTVAAAGVAAALALSAPARAELPPLPKSAQVITIVDAAGNLALT